MILQHRLRWQRSIWKRKTTLRVLCAATHAGIDKNEVARRAGVGAKTRRIGAS